MSELEKAPLLSIIIPCWNVELYIGELLNSIISQTYANWQVLAIDDCSTDKTAEIIKSFQNTDVRIQYIKRYRHPKGAQTCRNIGLESAVGSKYVIFVDGDDILSPHCLQQRVNYMESHPNLDFSVFPAKVFSEEIWDSNTFMLGVDDVNDVMKGLLLMVLPFSVWNNIYRLDSLQKYNLKWDEKILSLQDTDFNIQALLCGMNYAFAKSSEIDYFWRVIPKSNSTTKKVNSKEHFDSHIYLLEKLYMTLPLEMKGKYKRAIQHTLLFFLEKMKNDSTSIEKMCHLSCLDTFSLWYKIRFIAYSKTRNNSKFKKLLFPNLITEYLHYEASHGAIVKKKYLEKTRDCYGKTRSL